MAPKSPLTPPPPIPRYALPMPSSPPAAIPESFFADIAPPRPAELGDLSQHSGWKPTKAMTWYDAIIDDMFAHPGTSLKETAARLGRSPVTVGLIVRSDLFKARYAQRREAFASELDMRLAGKLAKVAETALDLTQEVLNKKRDSVPLPLLNEITKGALDRLGYGPSRSESAQTVSVTVNNQQAVSAQVSPDALARARENLRLLQTKAVDVTPSPVVAGLPDEGVEGEG